MHRNIVGRTFVIGSILLGSLALVHGLTKAVAKERVFRVMTGGLKGVDTNERFHIVHGPHILPLGPLDNPPLAAGGLLRDYDLGKPTYGRHVNGVTTPKDLADATFEVYTASEINEMLQAAETKSNKHTYDQLSTSKAEILRAIAEVGKKSIEDQRVVALKATLRQEVLEELKQQMREQLRADVAAELKADKDFRAAIKDEILAELRGGK